MQDMEGIEKFPEGKGALRKGKEASLGPRVGKAKSDYLRSSKISKLD